MGNAESHPEETTAVLPNETIKGKLDAVNNEQEDDVSSGEKREAEKHQKRTGSSARESAVSRRNDDLVNVNMPMADLMAYLQVVANNSNQLPLTVRDDPELDRAVNSLSSEEYARKSAAFIPADVRVLGGVFTRYGRVWDLPTSEVR